MIDITDKNTVSREAMATGTIILEKDDPATDPQGNGVRRLQGKQQNKDE